LNVLISFQLSDSHRHLYSFPTRRSSDLDKPLKTTPSKYCCGDFGELNLKTKSLGAGFVFFNFFCKMPDILLSIFSVLAAIPPLLDRKSTRLNSSHVSISYAVFCLIKNTV